MSKLLTRQGLHDLCSSARYLRCPPCLLDMPNIVVRRCNTLNPALLMPLPTDGDPHDCVAELEVVCSSRPQLTDEPLINPYFLKGEGTVWGLGRYVHVCKCQWICVRWCRRVTLPNVAILVPCFAGCYGDSTAVVVETSLIEPQTKSTIRRCP